MIPLLSHIIGKPTEIVHYLPQKLHRQQCLVIIQRSSDKLGFIREIGKTISSLIEVSAAISETKAINCALQFQEGAGLHLPITKFPTIDELCILKSLCHGYGVLVTVSEDSQLENTIATLTNRNFSPYHLKPGDICMLLFDKKIQISTERYFNFSPTDFTRS